MTIPGFDDGTIRPFRAVNLMLADGPHPWEEANRDAIAGSWRREEIERPWLYNGTVLMHRALRLDAEGILSGISHRASYAALLHFIRVMPEADCWHLFGSAVPVAADGPLVLIRMAEKTANAGRVYAPAGSLDEKDIAGGIIDIDGSMTRETREETGFDLSPAAGTLGETRLWMWCSGRGITVFRRYRLAVSAAVAARQIEAHRANGGDPEIAGAVILNNAEDPAVRPLMPSYMIAFADFHFANPDFP